MYALLFSSFYMQGRSCSCRIYNRRFNRALVVKNRDKEDSYQRNIRVFSIKTTHWLTWNTFFNFSKWHVCARTRVRIQHNTKWGIYINNNNNNVKEDIVKLYCLSCHISFRTNFTLFMYVVCINEFDINVLTRNYLCTVVLQISPTNCSTTNIKKFKCLKYIYDKQMLSTVCSGEVTRNLSVVQRIYVCRFYVPQNRLACYFIRITIYISVSLIYIIFTYARNNFLIFLDTL